jgi:hypothetical protein
VSTSGCERAAQAALELDTAEAVEELIAATFAPVLFDLLTGNADEPFSLVESGAFRDPLKTIPDR